jgi:hypothetical protein
MINIHTHLLGRLYSILRKFVKICYSTCLGICTSGNDSLLWIINFDDVHLYFLVASPYAFISYRQPVTLVVPSEEFQGACNSIKTLIAIS